MSSPAIATVITMMEFLPAELQEQVAEHLREYIVDLQDEPQWDASFKCIQDQLIAASRLAKAQSAATSDNDAADVDAILEASQGCWGNMGIEEIDARLDRQRRLDWEHQDVGE